MVGTSGQAAAPFNDRNVSLEALAESEQRSRTLVEALPDAILVHSEDKIVFVNPFCVRLLGAAGPEQLLGKDINEVVNPDDLPAIRNRIQDCYASGVLVVLAVVLAVLSFAQDTAAPSFTPGQLDKLVARIALYPDSLLAQVLAAATYSDQIPDAARWADQHHYLTGQALADAIQADHLPWDPSVQALLPFPSVLEMMANDMIQT